MSGPRALSYVLPVRWNVLPDDSPLQELCAYLAMLRTEVADVIVTDGSPDAVFAAAHARIPVGVRHVQTPMPSLMGKVDGVMAGLRLARETRVIIADDDVRHGFASLRRIDALLQEHDLVRPQNYFDPLPWHALWDTGRTLLNRLSGGDWPGTLGVRRELVLRAGGYSGDVMFENLELARVVQAAGGSTHHAPDVYVRRMPPSLRQFLNQRIRQAYDEFARPPRLVAQLALLPLGVVLAMRRPRALIAAPALIVLAAEVGRRRDGGRAYFPLRASLFAPLWVLERGVTSWLALGSRVVLGGVRYRGRTIRTAAHSVRELRRTMDDVSG